MSGPFSNATDGDLFFRDWCQWCTHFNRRNLIPCEEFTPAFIGEWPEILQSVPRSTTAVVGVECRKFERGAS